VSALGRVVGPISVVGGVVTAAALGGMTAQRMALHHYRQLDQVPGWDPADDFDSPPTDRSYSVATADGVALHVEEVGPADAPLTVIFAHGWTLRLGSWYFQRVSLSGSPMGAQTGRQGAPANRSGAAKSGPGAAADAASSATCGPLRLVFYDQRSHGRSSRAPAGHSTMDDLANDLATVIATAAPTGPVVLVGHSMGGMAVMALAEKDPALFTARVHGVGLISTSAVEDSRGLGRYLQINGSNPLLPWMMSVASRYPRMLERSRSASRDAVWLMTRALGFADPKVPAPLVDYLDEMISGTPVDVIADFAPALYSHDERGALPVLAGLPALIAVGAEDRMTPPSRSEAMAEALPRAELLIVPDAGHMAMMEAPEAVTAGLARLIDAACRFDSGAVGRPAASTALPTLPGPRLAAGAAS